jgi:methionine-rich copper-binding protein CopC/putative copper export protein
MNKRSTLVVAVVALAALVGGGAAPAAAHPIPIQATPEAGVVTTKASTPVSVALTEPVVVRGSSIVIVGPSGQSIATRPVQATAGGRVLTVKPRHDLPSAVYKVRWTALGEDGHLVNGSFRFGVAGPKGAPPPGAESLTGAGERLDADTSARDGIARVVSRWLGILAASLLLGGALLLRALRRRGHLPATAPAALLRLAPAAWVGVVVAAVGGVVTSALTSGGFDLGLLVTVSTAVSDLVRLGYVAVLTPVLLVLHRRGGRAVESAYLGGAVAVLATYAISGHTLSEPSWPYLIAVVVHVLAAGVWVGGVGVVALATRAGIDVRTALRSYAPLAVGALVLAIVTGVFAAVREVDHWYFLRWSAYGRVVLVKATLVAVVALLGYVAWRRARAERPARPLVRAELIGALTVLALAATLPGLVQGREQPLPAQRGTLFPGPAFASVLLGKTDTALGLAPARVGENVLTVGIAPERRTPRTVSVRLKCTSCETKPRTVRLERHGGRTWSAPVTVGSEGRWLARVTVDNRSAPSVPLHVGVPRSAGAEPVTVLAVADLSGPAAERCRAHIIGLELALARINADGGLDGGRKVAPLVVDSGGTPGGAAQAAAKGLSARPIASAGTCGDGGVAAVDAISRAGVPSIVGDPAVDPTEAPGAHRLAADPYVQGVAFGQLIRGRVLPAGEPGVDVVRVAVADDLQGRRLLSGLRAGLKPSAVPRGFPSASGRDPQVLRLRPGALAELDDEALIRVLDRRQTSALIVDQPAAGGADVRALERIGADRGLDLVPPPVLLSERVLSETVVRAAGSLGRIGAVQGVSEVATNMRDAELYQLAVPQLFRGEIASLDGLRGYATGLALRDAVRDGTSRHDIRAGLKTPRVFTDSLLAPWSPRAPGVGSPSVVALQPQFIAPTLVPTFAGGEAKDSEYFPQGSWTVTAPVALGIIAGVERPAL